MGFVFFLQEKFQKNELKSCIEEKTPCFMDRAACEDYFL
jgi:hypothetical protein